MHEPTKNLTAHEESEAIALQTMARWFIYLAFIVAVPALLLQFMSNQRDIESQNRCLGLAIALAVATVVVTSQTRDNDARILGRAVLGMCGIIIALIVWNKIFFAHLADVPGVRALGVFRTGRRSLHWPMYGKGEIADVFRSVPAVLIGTILAGRIILAIVSRATIERALLLQLVVLLTLFIWALAFTENSIWRPVHYAAPRYGTERFTSISDLLQNYVARQKDLGTFNRHYPPGFMLLFMIEDRLHMPLLELTAPLLVALSLLAVNGLGKSLALDDRTRLIAIGLTASSIGLAIYASLTPTTALLPISTLAVMYLVRYLKSGNVRAACIFGGLVALYSFFSFTTGMLGLALAAFVFESIRTRAVSFRRAMTGLGVAFAMFAFIFLLMYVVTGFNLIDCVREAYYRAVQSNGRTFDHPIRYLLRGSGSVLAYLASCGPGIAVLGLGAVGRNSSDNVFIQPIAVGVSVGVLMSGVLGLGQLETERIWVFFTPLLALAASAFVTAREESSNRVAVVSIIGACVFALSQEIFFRHY